MQRIADAWATPQRDAVLRPEYEAIEKISIDYAVMEHATEVLVVQAPYRWDDVGSWLALERMNPQDADGNTVLASTAASTRDDCVIVGDAGQLIATIGVEQPADHPGRRRHAGRRPPRRGQRSSSWWSCCKKKGLEKYL